MKASQLAEILMEHPDADVCMEYIPYGGPPSIQATHYPEMGVVLLDYAEQDDEE